MIITFSWECHADRLTPISRSNLLNQDDVSLLDCILMDDGGLTDSETIPWLEEGLKRTKLVAAGEAESSDWDRETWGVEFRNNLAKIYSLHDENYVQTLDLNTFHQVLQAWTAFVRSKSAGPLSLEI